MLPLVQVQALLSWQSICLPIRHLFVQNNFFAFPYFRVKEKSFTLLTIAVLRCYIQQYSRNSIVNGRVKWNYP